MSRNHLLLFFCVAQFSMAQNNLTVLDSLTQNPIPFASILLNRKQGWITNDEGRFRLPPDKELTAQDTLVLSSLGYKTLKRAGDQLQDSIFYLAPEPFELDEVILTNRNLTAEEIIEKLKEKVHLKYDLDFHHRRVFFRESGEQEFKKMNVEVRRNSIAVLGQSFWDSLIPTIPPKTTWHQDILTHSYGNYTRDQQKLKVIKALELADESDFIFEDMGELFKQIIAKHVKKDSYFKVRSGLMGGKIDQEDLMDKEKDSSLTQEELNAKKATDYMKAKLYRFKDIFGGLYSDEELQISILEKEKHYTFNLIGLRLWGDIPVYEIDFTTKTKGKYQGKLFVDADRFALVRLEYQNIKPIYSFSMFKVFFKQFLKTATVQFKLLDNGRYTLQYCELKDGNETGIQRPLNIIEKNKNVRGRRKQNELAMNVDLHFNTLEKQHLVVLEQEELSAEAFESLELTHTVLPEERMTYDPAFWADEHIIEPNEAIRNYNVTP